MNLKTIGVIGGFCLFIIGLWGCGKTNEVSSKQQSISNRMGGEPVVETHSIKKTTLAQERLEKIVSEQEKLLHDLENNPDNYSPNEKDRLLEGILRQYARYVEDNPKDVYAYILYGKFLRTVGEFDLANQMFMKADTLDSNIAVVKQQIGNYFAERGDHGLALSYFLSAIDCEPSQALYHFQLGDLLSNYKNAFIRSGFEQETLNQQMLNAFKEAARLSPNEWIYQMRLAETYYDMQSPDWEQALDSWRVLEAKAPTQKDREVIYLHEGRVLTQLGRLGDARRHLGKVYLPELEATRRELLEDIRKLEVQPENS